MSKFLKAMHKRMFSKYIPTEVAESMAKNITIHYKNGRSETVMDKINRSVNMQERLNAIAANNEAERIKNEAAGVVANPI